MLIWGHFGRTAIRVDWFAVVMPALVLNYYGQGALVLSDPTAAGNPFFLLFPAWALLPAVLLTTAATIIASQAVISGAFALVQQAIQLGVLPASMSSRPPMNGPAKCTCHKSIGCSRRASWGLRSAFAVLMRWPTPMASLLPVTCW